MVRSHIEQIQALIADIDGVLQLPSPRLPWMGDAAKDRGRVLERIRTYLLEQQQKLLEAEREPRAKLAISAADDRPDPSAPESSEQYDANDPRFAKQLLQAVVRDMAAMRSELMQPLLSDMQSLQRERDSLLREIRQLEAQRQQQHSLAQQSAYQQQIISEFLQTLMVRLQESLTQQVTQTLANVENQFLGYESQPNYPHPPLKATELEDAPTSYTPIWDGADAYGSVSTGTIHPRDRAREVQLLQSRIDQMLSTLDSTVSVVFEALLRNVRGYEESLTQGIDKMHSLGQQGEVMFAQLTSILAQKLGQEAAGLLHSSIHRPELEPATSQTAASPPTEPTPPPSEAKKRPQTTQKARRGKEISQTLPSKAMPPAAIATALPASPTPQQLPPVAPTAPDDRAIDLLMNLEESSPPLPSLASASASDRKAPAPQEAEAVLELMALEWPNPESAVSSNVEKVDKNALSTSSDLDELYASLFGLEEANPLETVKASNERSRGATLKNPSSGAIDLFEEALFDGLADPAIQNAEPTRTPRMGEVAVQSLEEFLFAEDSTAIALDDFKLEELLAQTAPAGDRTDTPEPADWAEVESEAAETVNKGTALNEEIVTDVFGDAESGDRLLPQESLAHQSLPPSAEQSDSAILAENWEEDSYIPASPEEVLLPIAEVEAEEESNFSLNSNTLQQLKADLSALEGFDDFNEAANSPSQRVSSRRALERSPSQPPPTPTPNTPSEEDWNSLNLSDWVSDVETDLANNPPNEDSNYITEAAPTAKNQTEQQADSLDSWLSELSGDAQEERAISEIPPVTIDTQNMTLDRAFANLTEAIATTSPVEEDLLQPQSQIPETATPEALASGETTSTLDDLFASMSEQSLEAEESSGEPALQRSPIESFQEAADLQASSNLDDLLASIWAETPTPLVVSQESTGAQSRNESVPETPAVASSSEAQAASNLDDLLASIWAETPTPSLAAESLQEAAPVASSTEDMAFSNLDDLLAGIWSEPLTLEDSSANTQTENLAPPEANPARKDFLSEGKKKEASQ